MIFNPTPQDILSISVPVSDWANTLVKSMNSTKKSESLVKNFLVTDVYSQFLNKLNLMSFNLNPLSGSLSLDLVHQNAAGHRLIADMNYVNYNEKLQKVNNAKTK